MNFDLFMTIEWLFLFLILPVTSAYFLLMGALTYGLMKIRRVHPMSRHVSSYEKPVKVSVIIPVRNESANIRNCLEDLLKQDYPVDLFEIIVSDDFSEDHTVSYARLLIQQNPEFPLSVLTATGIPVSEAGKKKAITRAIDHASGELIMTTDADTRIGSKWITTMVKAYKAGGTHMVLGPVAYEQENNLLCKIQSLEFLGLMGVTAASSFLHFPLMCNGANLAYTKTAFCDTGGFSDNDHLASGDDVFLMSNIGKHYGVRSISFVFDPLAVVTTVPESSISGFIAQRLRWVSKSRGYRDKGIILVAILTWLTHFLILTSFIISFQHPVILSLTFGLWIFKILADYFLVRIMAGFFKKKNLLDYYFPAQIFQLFYVVIIGITGNLFSYSWKGRKFSK